MLAPQLLGLHGNDSKDGEHNHTIMTERPQKLKTQKRSVERK